MTKLKVNDMAYNDLFEVLQDVDTSERIKFFLSVQASFQEKMDNGRYPSGVIEWAIDDLIQFAKDMQCEGFCVFIAEEDERDPLDYSVGSGRFN